MSALFLPFEDSPPCRDGVILTGGDGGRIIQVKALPVHPRVPSVIACGIFFGSGK